MKQKNDKNLIAHYHLEQKLARQLMAASKEQRQDQYGEEYSRLAQELQQLGRGQAIAQNNPYQVRLCLDLIASFIPSDAVFVEYGAGDGALADSVRNHLGTQLAIATDSSTAFSRGKHNASQAEPTVIHPNELTKCLHGKRVDLAFSCHLIEHLHPEDLLDHFQDVFSVLARQGQYIIITPNRLLGPHDVSRDFDPVATGLHLREYTHGDLIAQLKSSGFSNPRILKQTSKQWSAFWPVPTVLLESLLGTVPRQLRCALLEFFGQQPPFRAMEQVIVVAAKS